MKKHSDKMLLYGKVDIIDMKIENWMGQLTLNRGYTICKALDHNDNLAYYRNVKKSRISVCQVW